jgi:hypothetical protein
MNRDELRKQFEEENPEYFAMSQVGTYGHKYGKWLEDKVIGAEEEQMLDVYANETYAASQEDT